MNFSPNDSKQVVFDKIQAELLQNFTIVKKDDQRPWGGFFVIQNNDAEKFISVYFSDLPKILFGSGNLCPKILIVAPQKKLSWQYHFRRAEIWKLISGTAGVIISKTDEQKAIHTLDIDEVIKIECGERHRLIGLQNWGIVAELWQHTDINHPSDENDIVRLEDDFGR